MESVKRDIAIFALPFDTRMETRRRISFPVAKVSLDTGVGSALLDKLRSEKLVFKSAESNPLVMSSDMELKLAARFIKRDVGSSSSSGVVAAKSFECVRGTWRGKETCTSPEVAAIVLNERRGRLSTRDDGDELGKGW